MREDTPELELHVTLYGYCRADIYRYKDQSVAVFKNIATVPNERQKGYGNELLATLENIARGLGCDSCVLWADRSAWMHDWYKRRGYEDYADYDDPAFVWMYKSLN